MRILEEPMQPWCYCDKTEGAVRASFKMNHKPKRLLSVSDTRKVMFEMLIVGSLLGRTTLDLAELASRKDGVCC